MEKELKVILAENNEGFAILIKRNLERAGLLNEIIHFKNGQETTLDFLFKSKEDKDKIKDVASLLLLDIKMPEIDGIEVLRRVKEDMFLKKIACNHDDHHRRSSQNKYVSRTRLQQLHHQAHRLRQVCGSYSSTGPFPGDCRGTGFD